MFAGFFCAKEETNIATVAFYLVFGSAENDEAFSKDTC
jgi:hypothetical protein